VIGGKVTPGNFKGQRRFAPRLSRIAFGPGFWTRTALKETINENYLLES